MCELWGSITNDVRMAEQWYKVQGFDFDAIISIV